MANRYRNKFETRTGEWLDERGTKFGYETERIGYTVSGKYTPDFIVTTVGGNRIYIETKGNGRSFDGASRRKLIAVKEQHPELEIKLLFYSDGVIGPKRKDGTRMLQSDWSKKHGFDYAIKEIPDRWLEDV